MAKHTSVWGTRPGHNIINMLISFYVNVNVNVRSMSMSMSMSMIMIMIMIIYEYEYEYEKIAEGSVRNAKSRAIMTTLKMKLSKRHKGSRSWIGRSRQSLF